MLAKPGDTVTEGQDLLRLHTDEPERFERALAALEDGVVVSPAGTPYDAGADRHRPRSPASAGLRRPGASGGGIPADPARLAALTRGRERTDAAGSSAGRRAAQQVAGSAVAQASSRTTVSATQAGLDSPSISIV